MSLFTDDMVRLLYVLVCLLLLKFVINLVKYFRTRWYLSRYIKWLSSTDAKLLESKAQVVHLLKDAGVEDSYVGVAQPVGWGYLQTSNASVFANFPNERKDFAQVMHSMFREAIGTYRARMIETFNPLYWLEWLINLPREVLGYLGVPAESVLVKILQIVWWAVGAILSLLYVLYKAEIRTFIERWLS